MFSNFFTCNSTILTCCLICMIIIFIYIKQIDDYLGGKDDEFGRKERYIYFKGGQFSYWTISHFLFFMFLGFICPKNLILVILLGLLWELMELYFEYDRQTKQTPFFCKYINNCKISPKISKNKFWKLYTGRNSTPNKLFYCSAGYIGQILDVVFNILGYLFGSALNRIIIVNIAGYPNS
jgi:hypothetical protein